MTDDFEDNAADRRNPEIYDRRLETRFTLPEVLELKTIAELSLLTRKVIFPIVGGLIALGIFVLTISGYIHISVDWK